MPMIELRTRFTARLLWRGNVSSQLAAVERADKEGVDLCNADLAGANLCGVTLTGVALCNVDLSDASLVGANLAWSDLSGADLLGADLPGADLTGAILNHVDLRYADLRYADLRGCDLFDVDFSQANLRGVKLDAAHWVSVPCLDQKIWGALQAGGTLNTVDAHCGPTTHSRAGWAVTLAGQAGADLEARLGPSTAGALIYQASAGYVPDFFANPAETLADIRQHAMGSLNEDEE